MAKVVISPKEAAKSVAELVRAMRIDAGLTQREIADRLDVSQSVISKMENSARPRGASIRSVLNIARVCGMKLRIGFLKL